jgi:ABC-type glycerol-3-phosphate transport system substrate-binding protein
VLALEHPVAAVQQLLVQHADVAAKEAGVQVTWQAASPTDLLSTLALAQAARQLPAAALVGSADSALLAAKGLLVDVREALDRVAGLNGDLFPPFRDLTIAGPFVDVPANRHAPVWAIPHLSLGGAWLSRRDLLDKYAEGTPKIFDDVRLIAEHVTAAGGDTFGWGATLALDDATDNLVQVVLLNHGTGIFESRGLRVVVDSDAATAAFQALARLYRTDSGTTLAPPDVVDWSQADLAAAFVAGRVAQTVDHGGLYDRVLQGAPKLRTSVAALPPVPGPKGWYTAAVTSLFVTFRGATADRATALVERILQPARYDAVVRAGRGSAIPPYAYLTKGPFWDDDPNYAVFAANARGDPARDFRFATLGDPAPLTLPVAAVRGARLLAELGRSVARGDLPPSAAAVALSERAQTLARVGLASQPTPIPTPVPDWLQWLQSASQALK